MSSFGIPPRPAPIPFPRIDMATYHAPTLSTIMRPDAERLASIVHSALIVHFGTEMSLDTWPVCLENHLANFLHGAQLPQEYVSIALILLAQLSFDNPNLYAANDDAECLFYGAMYTVVVRYADHVNYYDEAERYARFKYIFKDRRWKVEDWTAILAGMKRKFNSVWDKCDWVKMLDIDTFVFEPRPFVRSPSDFVKSRAEWNRTKFFREVIRGVMEGDNQFDPELAFTSVAGPVGVRKCKIDCRLYCCFERDDKYPLPNDAPNDMPIHMAYRPWLTEDPRGGDYKHNTNGRLHIWTKGLDPKINPQLKFYSTVVESPYQCFAVISFRENGVPWKLNTEEQEMWKGWQSHMRRARIIPQSTDMEKKLSKEIKKLRELRVAVEATETSGGPSGRPKPASRSNSGSSLGSRPGSRPGSGT